MQKTAKNRNIFYIKENTTLKAGELQNYKKSKKNLLFYP